MKTKTSIVEKLRANGFLVSVVHYRNTPGGMGLDPIPEKEIRENKWHFHPRGGKTEVYLNLNGKEAVGVANCSILDGYNRKTGYKMALKRALDKFKNKKDSLLSSQALAFEVKDKPAPLPVLIAIAA